MTSRYDREISATCSQNWPNSASITEAARAIATKRRTRASEADRELGAKSLKHAQQMAAP
jgi:hypothetical protein